MIFTVKILSDFIFTIIQAGIFFVGAKITVSVFQ